MSRNATDDEVYEYYFCLKYQVPNFYARPFWLQQSPTEAENDNVDDQENNSNDSTDSRKFKKLPSPSEDGSEKELEN